jgi:hypothetical protein
MNSMDIETIVALFLIASPLIMLIGISIWADKWRNKK